MLQVQMMDTGNSILFDRGPEGKDNKSKRLPTEKTMGFVVDAAADNERSKISFLSIYVALYPLAYTHKHTHIFL